MTDANSGIKIFVAFFVSLIFVQTGVSFCLTNLISFEIIQRTDIIFIHNELMPSCEEDITIYCSITLSLSEFTDARIQLFGDTTIVIASTVDFEISEIVNKISNMSMALLGRLNCIIVVPKFTARIYDGFRLILPGNAYLKTTRIFLMELDLLAKTEAATKSVLAWRVYHMMKILELQELSISLPLIFEDIDQHVDIPGNLQNVSIKAVGLPLESINPHLLQTRTLNGKFEFISGYDLEVINYLAEALNFSIIPIRAESWIRQAKNGSLTGMGAQVVAGEADIGISSSEYLPYRHERLSFLHSTYSSPINAYIVRKSASNLRDVYFNCFDVRIWLSIVSSWILSSLLIKAFAWLKHTTGQATINDNDVGHDAVLFVEGAACQQGWFICPDSVSLRLIVLASFITHMVCYAAFTATLVSVLSVDQQLIRESSDLTKYQYRIYSDNAVLAAEYISHKLAGKLINDPSLANGTISTVDGFQKIYTEKAGLISITDYFYPQLKLYFESNETGNVVCKSQEKICKDIQQILVTRIPLKAGTFLPKHSPLKPYFNQKILVMLERGVRHRFVTTFYRKSTGQCGKAEVETVAIKIKDVWAAILILLFGFVSSLIVAMVEVILSCLSLRNMIF